MLLQMSQRSLLKRLVQCVCFALQITYSKIILLNKLFQFLPLDADDDRCTEETEQHLAAILLKH